MTSKNFWFDRTLIRDTLIKNIWLPTLSFVGFFFALPVTVAIQMHNFLRTADPTAMDYGLQLTRQVNQVLITNQWLSFWLLLLGAALAACTFFAYLHKKKQVDFYHSLPLKREALFFTNYLAGMAAVILPYLLNFLLAFVVLFFFQAIAALDMAAVCAWFGIHVLFFTCVYAVCVVAGMLTGHIIIHVLGMVTLLGVGPLLVGTYAEIMNVFYENFYGTIYPFDRYIAYSSPVCRWVASLEMLPIKWWEVVAWLIAAVLLTNFALWLYQKRRSEAAGTAMAFSRSKPFIKYPIVFFGTFFVGMFFHQVGDEYHQTYGWMIFGFLCGAFLISRVMEMIYDFDFRAMRKNWRGLLVFILVFAVFISVPMFDLSKYDAYVPDKSEIASIDLYLPDVDRYAYLYDAKTNDANYMSTYIAREYAYLQASNLADPDNIAAALSVIRKTMAAGRQSETVGQTTEDGIAIDPDMPATQSQTIMADTRNEAYTQVRVVYHLKSGRSVARSYGRIAYTQISSELDVILNTLEYKQNKFAISQLSFDRLLIENVTSFENELQETTTLLNLDNTYKEGILSAYKQDLMDLNTTYMHQNLPIGQIHLRLYDGMVPQTEADRKNNYIELYYPLYASFSKTLEKLAAIGLDRQDFVPRSSAVTGIVLTDETSGQGLPLGEFYRQYVGGSYPVADNSISVKIDDRQAIAQIMQKTFPEDAFAFNIFLQPYQQMRFKVNYQLDYENATQTRYAPISWE